MLESVLHTNGKKTNRIDTDFVGPTLYLKDFQTAEINLFQELKQTTCKELREMMKTVSQQTVNIKSETESIMKK